MKRGRKTEAMGWIEWPDENGVEENNMKTHWIWIAILVYTAMWAITYDFTASHGFSQGEAIGTAVIWPVFWVHMWGD